MINLDFDQSRIPLKKRLSKKLVQSILDFVNKEMGRDIQGKIGASFVSDAEIRRLNRQYRQKDEVTDVLSFSYLDDSNRGDYLGEIAISYDQAQRQAENGDVELELVDLLVHGILHVLGYDHESGEEGKKMFSLQDRIIAEVL